MTLMSVTLYIIIFHLLMNMYVPLSEKQGQMYNPAGICPGVAIVQGNGPGGGNCPGLLILHSTVLPPERKLSTTLPRAYIARLHPIPFLKPNWLRARVKKSLSLSKMHRHYAKHFRNHLQHAKNMNN